MDDETPSHYIFLFMLQLIPFHVIGLSIEAKYPYNPMWDVQQSTWSVGGGCSSVIFWTAKFPLLWPVLIKNRLL